MGGSVSGFEVGLASMPPQCLPATSPPPLVGEQAFIVSIPVGQDRVAFLFPLQYASTPYPPTGTVLKPSTNADDFFFTGISDLSATGATAHFSAPITAPGYQFSGTVNQRTP